MNGNQVKNTTNFSSSNTALSVLVFHNKQIYIFFLPGNITCIILANTSSLHFTCSKIKKKVKNVFPPR